MNNLINEMVNICGLPYSEVNKYPKIVQIGNKLIYINNFLRIIDYSSTRLLLKIKNNFFEILGEDFEIKQLNKGEILVTGNILSSSFGALYGKKN